MKAESSDRELQSIESEFCLSKNDDGCRMVELWRHTCKRGGWVAARFVAVQVKEGS